MACFIQPKAGIMAMTRTSPKCTPALSLPVPVSSKAAILKASPNRTSRYWSPNFLELTLKPRTANRYRASLKQQMNKLTIMKKEHVVITVKADNRPGLLHLVPGLLERKLIRIESLSLAPTD